jgi:UTP:GlnB (protein PII) uridylyltransferase
VLTDLGLNVVQARAATLGHEVVDAFYIQSVGCAASAAENRSAITEALIAAASSPT